MLLRPGAKQIQWSLHRLRGMRIERKEMEREREKERGRERGREGERERGRERGREGERESGPHKHWAEKMMM